MDIERHVEIDLNEQSNHEEWRRIPGDGGTLVLNASRIGAKGGLHTFALTLMECLSRAGYSVEAVVPSGVEVGRGVKALRTPSWLAGSTNISRLRPIFWLVYSTFWFPSRRGSKILSATHHILPFRIRQIVTVHDLRPFYEPDNWVQYLYFRYLLPRGLRKCDGVITVSNTSKLELMKVYGIAEDRIHVVPNAIRPARTERAFFIKKHQTDASFLLVVGASWKHKNIVELLQHHGMWAHLYRLKIVAGRGEYLEELGRKALDLQMRDRIDLITDIDDSLLEDLYSSCSALVYPSRIEGFGIPPLEAMAHGKPVIVSDIPVTRELLGDVPFYVRLGDSDSWSEAFAGLLELEGDPMNWRRSAGVEKASSYSLERTERALLLALEGIWGT